MKVTGAVLSHTPSTRNQPAPTIHVFGSASAAADFRGELKKFGASYRFFARDVKAGGWRIPVYVIVVYLD